MGGRGRHLRMTIGLSAFIVLGVLASCTPQFPADDFYTPPETSTTVPTDEPTAPPTTPAEGAGELIRYEPSVFTSDIFDQKPNRKVDAFKVMYRSTNVHAQSNAVTGTVLVPKEPWTGEGARPLVTLGVGTRGLADSCAPSWTMSQGWDYEAFEYELMLKKGWVVAITDMVGLGTPGLHTYMVAREQGTALLDIARAALTMPETGLEPDSPIGITGYSQGGASAGWAAELESTYAPELNIKGTAAAGVPGDLLAVAKALDGTPFIGLAMMAALGYDAAYPELDLASFLNARGHKLISKAEKLCLTQFDGVKELVGTAGTWFSGYMEDKSRNPLKDPIWEKRLGENKLGSTAPTAPVLMQHGMMDQMVAFKQAKKLRGQWCALGADITWREHIIAEHVLGMVFSLDENIKFLADRFADKPVRSTNC